jgi:hypothetical protein
MYRTRMSRFGPQRFPSLAAEVAFFGRALADGACTAAGLDETATGGGVALFAPPVLVEQPAAKTVSVAAVIVTVVGK